LLCVPLLCVPALCAFVLGVWCACAATAYIVRRSSTLPTPHSSSTPATRHALTRPQSHTIARAYPYACACNAALRALHAPQCSRMRLRTAMDLEVPFNNLAGRFITAPTGSYRLTRQLLMPSSPSEPEEYHLSLLMHLLFRLLGPGGT